MKEVTPSPYPNMEKTHMSLFSVPGILNKNGVTGIKLDNYPSSFGALLNNQSGVIQLTTEAVLGKSKDYAYQALLADPVVDDALAAEKLLTKMLEIQDKYLGYLK